MNADDIDIGILSNLEPTRKRCLEMCEDFGFTSISWNDLDQFQADSKKPRLIVAEFTDGGTPIAVSEIAQLVRFTQPDAFLLCITGDTVNKTEADFARKSGVNYLLMASEIIGTAKLEFICLQTLHSRYFPIKATDLIAGTELPFDLYHLLPMRKKFLKAGFEGQELSQEKLTKLSEAGEFYIDRASAIRFKDYIRKTTDRSPGGIATLCRSQFLALQGQSLDLLFQLSAQAENASVGEGQELLKKCGDLCSELLSVLAEHGKPWEIVNNSTVGTFGSVERAPAIAAYTGFFGFLTDLPDTGQLMVSALLAELGLLLLPPGILKKLRNGSEASLTEEEKKIYRTYPLRSVEVCLNRKLSLPEKQRNLIQSTHERLDGSGFPQGLAARKIPAGSLAIGFARLFDQQTLVKMGELRSEPIDVLRKALTVDETNRKHFPVEWMDLLAKAIFP